MANIGDLKTCTGCAACTFACPQNCIVMVKRASGFLYPTVDAQACVDCGLCRSICPEITPCEKSKCRIQYAAYSKTPGTRRYASSGGIATQICKAFMEHGTVFGAKFEENKRVRHVLVSSPQEIQKSKYIQSDMSGAYAEIGRALQNQRSVLFIGCPCQVAAVRNLFGCANLYTCELLCHAVNSPGLFEDYVSYLEEKNGPIESYDFRSKQWGWSKASVEIRYKSKKVDRKRHLYDTFHNWFGLYLSVRDSCFACQYRTEYRVGDITLGDFWGIEKLGLIPDYEDGVSRVLVNTEKGAKLLAMCDTDILLLPVELQRTLDATGSRLFTLRPAPHPRRDEFFTDYSNGGVKVLVKKYAPLKPWQHFQKRVCRKLGSLWSKKMG